MRILGRLAVLAAALITTYPSSRAETVPLLPEEVVAAMAGELSGVEARRNVQALTLYHRMRGSAQFRSAAEWIHGQTVKHGLRSAEILELPADGTIFYGTQRSRPAWDAEFAELWELQEEGGRWLPATRIASWEDRPVTLAQDSSSGEVTADLVDVGDGASAEDYEGLDVSGKLVLVSRQPGSVRELAVDRFGAAGIVSYAQNQKTAWWKEDENLVRWGHVGTFPPPNTFAFMISLKQARAWRERLAGGETVRLQATVRAGQRPGQYDIPTAILPGADPELAGEEIVLSCHLDHQRPGANDNASGCATILEVGRALAKLVAEGKIAPPRRTLRFVWPPEIEGTLALLEGRPEIARRIRAAIHMDMVGGGPETKAIFHVTRSPSSLPSFVNDVAEEFGRFVNAQSNAHASGTTVAYPLVAPGGGKEALLAVMADFSAGSDHQIYTDGSFGIPAIYLNDWPDRYIHTDGDSLDRIDPTKLLRAAFIGAASAYYLSQLDEEDVAELWPILREHSLERLAAMMARQRQVGADSPEAANLARFQLEYERRLLQSIERFVPIPGAVQREAAHHLEGLASLAGAEKPAPEAGGMVFRRVPEPRGPMSVFGYDYLVAHLEERDLPLPELLEARGLWGGGSLYAYEALNLVDGRRSVGEIRDDLAAIYGPVSVELVQGYLESLESIGVLTRTSK